MRLSRLFAPTLRDDPADAEIASHRLLLRAGFMRQVTAGVYTTLPLGLRVMRKIEAIVREEMDAAGAQEIRMPILLPADAWKQTGRWDLYGEILFRLRDRHERDLLLGPTQEEVVTPLVAQELQSYRDLPVNLYQVEWKYRDEYRPRFGLLRVREFLMKDAYSFDRDEGEMRGSYEAMLDAYRRILDRCGLTYDVVEAEPGQIGGGVNHSFMAPAESGEDLYVACAQGDYLADVKAATPRPPDPVEAGSAPLEEVETPGAATIELVAGQLGIDASATLKCIMFDAGGRTVAVLVPGDREVQEEKVERLFFPAAVRAFRDDDFAAGGFAKGYVGPQSMPADAVVIADHLVRGGRDWVTGANTADRHVTGANTPRDFRVDRWEDVVVIREGDRCPLDGGALAVARSITVGHTYQLGTRYSAKLDASFVDEDGTSKPYEMGCYGFGISRAVAAAVEQFHDDAGIALPKVLAPFEAVVIVATNDHERSRAEAERIYSELGAAGVDVAIDDRDVAAGVKFNDADLIGYPVHVTVGKRGVEAGSVDLKVRATGDRSSAVLADATPEVLSALAGAP